MKEIGTTRLPSSSLPDSRWQLAQRVANGQNFRNCHKLRAFLLYVCENSLLGRAENVREQLIGHKVFGRPPDYNLTEDNIVRVEARELRKRLAAYFEGEGRDEPHVIEIPKGAYLPVFKPREQPPLEVAESEAAEPAVRGSSALAPSRQVWPIRIMAVGLVIMTAMAAWFGHHAWRSGQGPGSAGSDYACYPDLLGRLGTTPGRETLLVLSNPKVVLYYGTSRNEPRVEGAGTTVPAPSQLKSEFGEALNNVDRNLPFQFLHLTREDYTGMGEAVAAFHLGRLMQSLHRPARLTQGRFLGWDRVPAQDLLLLGSPLINDWTFQNAIKSNFNLEHAGIANAKPLPGEQSLYTWRFEPGTMRGTALTDYGVIKMTTSPYGFNTLLLAGMSSAGTAGVGEFFADARKMRDVWSRLRAATAGKSFPTNWEALIRITVRDGLPVETSAVSLRPAPSAR